MLWRIVVLGSAYYEYLSLIRVCRYVLMDQFSSTGHIRPNTCDAFEIPRISGGEKIACNHNEVTFTGLVTVI